MKSWDHRLQTYFRWCLTKHFQASYEEAVHVLANMPFLASDVQRDNRQASQLPQNQILRASSSHLKDFSKPQHRRQQKCTLLHFIRNAYVYQVMKDR